MKNLLLCIGILCLSFAKVVGQSTTQFIIKAYNTTEFRNVSSTKTFIQSGDTIFQTSTQSQTTFLHPSIALSWSKKSNVRHEMELARLSWTMVDSMTQLGNLGFTTGDKVTLVNIALRYEYQFLFGKTDSKIQPAIGIGALPFFSRKINHPLTSLVFYHRGSETGIIGQIVPRILVQLSPSFTLDVNVPLQILRSSLISSYYADPSLSLNNQRNAYFNFDAYSGIGCRIGIAYTIPQK